MLGRGLKRKCADPEEGVGAAPAYAAQRQLLLDMSLVKLQLCHVLAEPDLCRSVLIANTVRQIQEEMALDGAWRLAAPPGEGPAPRDRLVSTDILCRAAQEPGAEGAAQARELASELAAAACAQAPGSPRGGVWEMDAPRESRGSFQRSLDHILETLDGRPPSAAEGLFPDVDSSYYDLDSVLAGVVSGAKPAHRPSLDGLGAPAAPVPGASCRPDLGELDHIVEILVET